MSRRPSIQEQLVVSELFDVYEKNRSQSLYGREIADRTGLLSGTLSPLLRRLVDRGYVDSWSEPVDEAVAGRPRRRFYRLNDAGASWAREVLLAAQPAVRSNALERLLSGLLPARPRPTDGPDDSLSKM